MYIYIFICLLEIIALPHRETFTVFFFFVYSNIWPFRFQAHTPKTHRVFYIYFRSS